MPPLPQRLNRHILKSHKHKQYIMLTFDTNRLEYTHPYDIAGTLFKS